jgi:DNA-binding transcriptional LysR family regulator
MNVTLRQLQAFCAVARLGSFTKAASALHTTQPALSVQIGQLEDSLGLRLFDRTTRTVGITRVGQDLLPRAEKTLAELSEMVASAKGLGTRNMGRVMVAALPSVASSLLPEAIAGFQQRFPGIAVLLRDALGARVIDMVRSDEVDFGIGGAPPADAPLQFTPLGSDEMVAVCLGPLSPGKGRRIAVETLAAQPLILMSRDSSVRRIVEEAFAAAGCIPRPVQEPAYMSTAIAMVRAGLGIAVLPSSAAEVRAAGDLGRHRIASRVMSRQVGILSRGKHLSPAAEAFRRHLKVLAKDWFHCAPSRENDAPPRRSYPDLKRRTP